MTQECCEQDAQTGQAWQLAQTVSTGQGGAWGVSSPPFPPPFLFLPSPLGTLPLTTYNFSKEAATGSSSEPAGLPCLDPSRRLLSRKMNGDPDRGPAQTWECTGLGLQRVPDTGCISGCECQSLVLAVQGSRDNSCIRCDQVNDLLSLVADLKEEVGRLRSVREREREIDWWSPSLAALRLRQPAEAP